MNPTDRQFDEEAPRRGPSRRLQFDTLGGIVAVVLIVAFFAWAGGFPSAVISLGLCMTLTALFALFSARPSWLRLRSRPIAALALVGALIVTGIGISRLDTPHRAASPGTSRSASPRDVKSFAPSSGSSQTASPTARASGAVGDEAPVVVDRAAFNTTALALLSTLRIKGRSSGKDYDRVGDFGEAWIDVDHNGCDTRDDILTRDLTATRIDTDCDVETGTLVSPYTGASIAFTRGYNTSAEVQIDHVVALSDAWQTGAQQLTRAQRISFANDPLNLLAVDGVSNQEKSDSDAASWLPENKSFRCAYVARQVSVKVEYDLWVTQAEHDAMARILAACPTMSAPVSPFTG